MNMMQTSECLKQTKFCVYQIFPHPLHVRWLACYIVIFYPYVLVDCGQAVALKLRL